MPRLQFAGRRPDLARAASWVGTHPVRTIASATGKIRMIGTSLKALSVRLVSARLGTPKRTAHVLISGSGTIHVISVSGTLHVVSGTAASPIPFGTHVVMRTVKIGSIALRALSPIEIGPLAIVFLPIALARIEIFLVAKMLLKTGPVVTGGIGVGRQGEHGGQKSRGDYFSCCKTHEYSLMDGLKFHGARIDPHNLWLPFQVKCLKRFDDFCGSGNLYRNSNFE